MPKKSIISDSIMVSQKTLFNVRVSMLFTSLAIYANRSRLKTFGLKEFKLLTINAWLLIVLYLSLCLIHTMRIRS